MTDSKTRTSHPAHKGFIYALDDSVGTAIDYQPLAVLQTEAEQRPYLHLFPELTSHPRNTTHRPSLEPTTPPGSSPSDTSTMSSSPHTSAARNDHFQDSEFWSGPYPGTCGTSEHGCSSSNSHSNYTSEDESMGRSRSGITSHNPETINNMSTATKSNTKPFTRTSKAGNRHYVTPAGASAGLRCTFVENGQLCTAETFNLPSKMRTHLIDKHMDFSPFQCDNCMRVFTRLSLRTRHLEKADSGGRICPHQTTAGGEEFEIRKGVEEALWGIRLEQAEVDAAVELIKRYNGKLEARRRRGQSGDRSPTPGNQGRGPPSPLRDGHQPHGIRKNDHRRTRSTSTSAHSRNSQQYSVQSSHPHGYYHPQPQQQPLLPSHPPLQQQQQQQQQQILQAHPPQFPQNWGGTSATDYTYNSSPPGPSGYYPHP